MGDEEPCVKWWVLPELLQPECDQSKAQEKKRQTWAGVLTQELGYLPETETEWLEAFNLTGVLPPPNLRSYETDCGIMMIVSNYKI